ncbi:MAG: YigZ family protein [Clostridia bacterium]|nr:YigZ family protein [Clostridia bacterium]
MNSYQTLLQRAEAEYKVQKSRFIGCACPVATAESALAFLEDIRRKHRGASHNCYAYIIGRNAGIMRYSDDGEPGGTAGIPIMEGLKALGVTDAAVVVTRYFGGILLGAGGLARAYSHTCALAMEAARVCTMYATRRWVFEVAYPIWNKVLHALGRMHVRMEDTQFSTHITFTLLVKEQDEAALMDCLATLTDGKIESLCTDELYSPWARN